MDDEDEEQMRAALHNYFILSYDTLRSVPIPQEDLLTINHSLAKKPFKKQWNDKPPLPSTEHRKDLILKHKEVPSCLRCAVWISSVFQLTNPSMPQFQADTFATLGRIQSIELGWDMVLKECEKDFDVGEVGMCYPLFRVVNGEVEKVKMRRTREQDFGISEQGSLALGKLLFCIGMLCADELKMSYLFMLEDFITHALL